MVDADFNFKMPKIEMTEKSEDGKYGKFVVEPLERGYLRLCLVIITSA